jgi:RNA-directed DNA polymerase
MHKPIPEPGSWLRQVVRGYFAYHAVPTNLGTLVAFHHYVTDLWLRTLRRRSQKDRKAWSDMTKLAA